MPISKKKDIEAETFERARHLLRTTGLEVAINSLIAVCQDTKAPAPAKATAGVALMRANGLLNDKTDRSDKALSEMSPEEINESLAQLKADLASRTRGSDDGDEGGAGGAALFD